MCFICKIESMRVYSRQVEGYTCPTCIDLRPTSALIPIEKLKPKQRFDSRAFAMTIHEMRVIRKLSQTELAAQANISVRTLASIGGGHHIPRIDTLAAIAEVLDVTLDDMLHGRAG